MHFPELYKDNFISDNGIRISFFSKSTKGNCQAIKYNNGDDSYTLPLKSVAKFRKKNILNHIRQYIYFRIYSIRI